MIHIIDDEKDILEIVSDELTENNIDHKLHSSWKTCHPQAGDTVVHDLNGVGPMPAKIEGVRYLKFTGQSDLADIPKPFSTEDLISKLR